MTGLVQGLRELRLWLLGAAAVAVLLVVARCGGREDAETDANAALQRARIDTLQAAVVRDRHVIDSLARVAEATAAPHDVATASTRRAEASAEARIRTARAAIAAESLTVAEARRELEALAIATELLLAKGRLERAAAARRIEALTVTVVYVQRSAPTVDALVDAQANRIRTLERGRPWWRKALGAACEGGAVATGAGGGAAIAGPVGAAAGGVLGAVVGSLGCS